MGTLSDVIEKVQKLLNLADKSDKPGEIASAQKLAQQLITKYQIEEAQLNNHVGTGGIVCKRIDTPKPYVIDKSILLNAIAKHNFCKVLRGDKYCMIYGYASDIEICVVLYDTLLVHMFSEMRIKLEKANDQAFEEFNTKAWARSFFTGYSITIGERIKQSKQDTIKEASITDTSIAVIVSDKQHAIEEYFQKVDRKSVKDFKLSSPDGFSEGKKSGRKAVINPTLESDTDEQA